MMLEHLGEKDAAVRLMGAIEATTKQGRLHTPDLGGEASTELVTEAVLDFLG
jgi:tartrate dehydrogenase/decarboxylase/D-malate dehydrogenase